MKFTITFMDHRYFATKVVRGTKDDLQAEINHLHGQGCHTFSIVSIEDLRLTA